MANTSIKQKVLESIEKLPENADIDEIMERVYFIHKIENGLKQSEKGELISHKEVQKKIEQW